MKILKINDVPRCAARAQGVFQQPAKRHHDKKTGGMGEQFIDNVSDYVVWYCCSKQKAKFNRLYLPKAVGLGGGARYNQIQQTDGRLRPMSKQEKDDSSLIPQGCRAFLGGPLTSETASESTTFEFSLKGRPIQIRKGGWKTGKLGMDRLIKACHQSMPTGLESESVEGM